MLSVELFEELTHGVCVCSADVLVGAGQLNMPRLEARPLTEAHSPQLATKSRAAHPSLKGPEPLQAEHGFKAQPLNHKILEAPVCEYLPVAILIVCSSILPCCKLPQQAVAQSVIFSVAFSEPGLLLVICLHHKGSCPAEGTTHMAAWQDLWITHLLFAVNSLRAMQAFEPKHGERHVTKAKSPELATRTRARPEVSSCLGHFHQ